MLLGRRESLWATTKLRRPRESMCLVKGKWRYAMMLPFDEDASLRKVVNLPIFEKDHEARPGNQEEPKDETMPDAEGDRWTRLIHLLHWGRDHHGSGTLSRMPRIIWPQGGHSVKARSRVDTKGI